VKINRLIAVLMAGASATALSTGAHAQNSDAAPEQQPTALQAAGDQNAIVITAQKRAERLLDVPQSVSVISGESLANQHAQRLSDYLTRIPSANVVESQAGNSRIVLRGINAGGVGATVATYIDESPFGSATSLANGGVLAPDLDPFDLARVEVLRGPQGTLYGANSLGGLVKYVTVAPDPRAFDAAAEIGGEDVSHGDFGWWTRAAVNAPISDSAAVRASGFYRRDPGFIDNNARDTNDVNDGKTYGGRFSFLVKPTTALRIRASALLENIRSNGNNTIDLDPLTLHATHGLEQNRLVNEPNDIDYRLYNTTIDYDFGAVALVSSTSYGTLDQKQVLDASAVYGGGIGVDQGMTQRRFTQEVRLASSGPRQVEWTVGGFYTHEKNRLTQDLFGTDPATGDPVAALDGLILVGLPSRYSEYAGFANATWHIDPKFDLTGGGRWSHNKQSDEQTTSGQLLGPLVIEVSGKSSDSVFTYSLAPTFKPNANTRIYARIAKGYRPGGPNALSPDAPDTLRHFDPDTTTNYEVGLKTQTADHLLSLEVTAFLIEWKNIQLLAQIGGFGINANGGKARSQGVEFTAGINPTSDLSLFANGSYVDAQLTSDAPASVGGLDGDPLPYNPKWQATIGGEYEHPLSASVTGRAGISWHYTGKRYSDFDAASGQRRLSGFSQIDAHAGVDVGRFRLDAFARNLTNSRGIVNLSFFGAANGDIAAAITRPRSFGLALGYRY
jgi:outer membrane receptor protein involved in Fe transport